MKQELHLYSYLPSFHELYSTVLLPAVALVSSGDLLRTVTLSQWQDLEFAGHRTSPKFSVVAVDR